MPISFEQIDNLAEDIVDLYIDFESTIINDMARRISKMGAVTETAAWQMQRLTESGSFYRHITSQLATLTGKSDKELRKMFAKAGVMALRHDDSIYKQMGFRPMPLNMSPAMVAVLNAGLQKTMGDIHNLVKTTAYKSQQDFIQAANLAYMQVSTGTMSYEQALRLAVKKFSSSGIGIVYPSGHADKLDVAMLRAIRTGVSQTAGTLQLTRMDEMGVDLVQVSAHIGARDEHAVWQGKIYSRSGKHPKYPDFVKSTGYGTVTGLNGANCRHSFYPFFKELIYSADSNPYDKVIHQDYDQKTVTYNRDQMSIYEATQEQRKIERNIRKWKRERDAFAAAKLNNDLQILKVKLWQAQMRDFIRQTKLQRQRFRELA